MLGFYTSESNWFWEIFCQCGLGYIGSNCRGREIFGWFVYIRISNIYL